MERSETWRVEQVRVTASLADREEVMARSAVALVGTLYVGKRWKHSSVKDVETIEYSGHAHGWDLASRTVYGYESVYFQLMAACLALGLGFFSFTPGAFAFGVLACLLVGLALPSDRPTLVPDLIAYSGTVTVPTTHVEEWYIDPTLQGNKTFDGLPLANSYTRVVYDSGDMYCDPLARYDAYVALDKE